MFFGFGFMEKVVGIRFLYDIWFGEISYFVEFIVVVDDGIVLYFGICNDKFFICNKKIVRYLLKSFYKIFINIGVICCMMDLKCRCFLNC